MNSHGDPADEKLGGFDSNGRAMAKQADRRDALGHALAHEGQRLPSLRKSGGLVRNRSSVRATLTLPFFGVHSSPMTFQLHRSSESDEPLSLTQEHERLVAPRRGLVTWEGFDPRAYEPAVRQSAVETWQGRALTEMHSLALFTQLSSQVHLLGAPLDWSGAFARIIADEVRHTDLSLRLSAALGGPETVTLDETTFHLRPRGSTTLRAHVRHAIIGAFCIGETISGRMFRRVLGAATVPLARDVVAAILVDETFHGEFGWEVGAMLMREHPDFATERAQLVTELPALIAHFAKASCVTRGPSWTRDQVEVEPGENFGTLTDAGYARAFFDGMEADVVPGLEAIGLPQAKGIWRGFLAGLEG